MLIAHVERYISLRQTLGYKLRNTSRNLRAFARFAAAEGDTHVRISTAMEWATEGLLRLTLATFGCETSRSWPASCTPRIRHTRYHPIRFTRPSGGLCPTSTHRKRLCNLSERPVVFASRTRFDACLRDDARVDRRDRAPHFGGARPPAL